MSMVFSLLLSLCLFLFVSTKQSLLFHAVTSITCVTSITLHPIFLISIQSKIRFIRALLPPPSSLSQSLYSPLPIRTNSSVWSISTIYGGKPVSTFSYCHIQLNRTMLLLTSLKPAFYSVVCPTQRYVFVSSIDWKSVNKGILNSGCCFSLLRSRMKVIFSFWNGSGNAFGPKSSISLTIMLLLLLLLLSLLLFAALTLSTIFIFFYLGRKL